MTKLIRITLYALLAFLAYFLGSKVVQGKDCSGCPGYGICNGETDCNKY